MKPFLKWAGGKHRLLDKILPHLPAGRRLVEPFLGGGAVFANTEYEQYTLSDANLDVVYAYRFLRDNGDEFIDACESLFTPDDNSEWAYYTYREEFNDTAVGDMRRSSLFVYLNRHGFNGLCRYNRNGGYNVPFGKYSKPHFPKAEMLAFATKLQRATVLGVDFEANLDAAGLGDVVYCDPPYAPLSDTASFTSYTGHGFSPSDHFRLMESARRAASRGATVVISNRGGDDTESLYYRATIHRFSANRSIAASGSKRQSVDEILAVYAAE